MLLTRRLIIWGAGQVRALSQEENKELFVAADILLGSFVREKINIYIRFSSYMSRINILMLSEQE